MDAGLTEEWDATIEMMETMLPTYFEGFHANITTDGTCSSSSHVCRVCLCLLLVSLDVSSHMICALNVLHGSYSSTRHICLVCLVGCSCL